LKNFDCRTKSQRLFNRPSLFLDISHSLPPLEPIPLLFPLDLVFLLSFLFLSLSNKKKVIMVLLSLGRLFLLLSACALLLAYARPTFRDRVDAIKENHHHSVAHTHPADKHTKAHVSKDQGKLETGSDAENDDDAASSDNDDGETSPDEEVNGANVSTGAGGGPRIRSGILTTCTQPNHFAMTFDDGPYEYTDALIDLLISEKVVATFFVNGKNYW
jgi:hypothetical protein